MDKLVVDLREAEQHFEKLTPLLRGGQTIVLSDANQPFAEIRPLPPRGSERRPFGLARGKFTVPADFGDSDPRIQRMFYGEQ